jgi:hypothetical protein
MYIPISRLEAYTYKPIYNMHISLSCNSAILIYKHSTTLENTGICVHLSKKPYKSSYAKPVMMVYICSIPLRLLCILIGMYMRADINRMHPLSTYADAVSKNHYLHMQMWILVLEYANAVINCIHIPFIYNIYNMFYICLMFNKFTKTTSF